MTGKPLAEQMAALNNLDDTSESCDRSASLLNATCPGRIQNSSNNSFNAREDRVARRLKREPFRISPLEQIDENPRGRRPPSPRRYNTKYPDAYKTSLCEAFRRQGVCPYDTDCPFAHGTDDLRPWQPRRKTYSRGDSSRHHRDTSDDSIRVPPRRNDENRRYQHMRDRGPPICKNFERGSCRYGPRCKFIHREQMQVYEPNASLYVPSEPLPYYQGNQCYVAAPQYFLPPPGPQFVPADLNQTMPIYTTTQQVAMNVNGTYYFQPFAPTPVLDQAPTPQPLLMMNEPHIVSQDLQTLPDFRRPPPPLMQIM